MPDGVPVSRPLGSGAGELREKVTVERFLAQGREPLQLRLVAGGLGLDRVVPEAALNRPGLALAGFFRYFAPHRLQIIGKHEHAYLGHIGKEERIGKLRRLFSRHVPAIIVCRGLAMYDGMSELADRTKTPLLSTGIETHYFINAATLLMEDLVGLHEVVHGTMIEVFGQGVLLVGEAGIGKSETALGLIKRGHALVSDDTTMLRRDSSGRIMAASVEPIADFMEIRGIGIIHVPSVFGIAAIRGEKQLDLVMDLERPADAEPYIDRTGETTWYRDILGLRVPEVVVPVAPGRDMVNMVETAVCEYKLRAKGYHAARALDERVLARNAQILKLHKVEI